VPHTLRGLRYPSCRVAVKRCGILSCPLPASRVRPAPSVRSRACPSAGVGAVSPLRGASVRASYPPLGGVEHLPNVSPCHRAPKSATAGSPLDSGLQRPPLRALRLPDISEETSDKPLTPIEDLFGFIDGLRAHITAPKSSSVNPTHLQSPKRLSMSSSSHRGPERPFCEPPTIRD